jgi:hypothetical protein
MVTTTFGNEIDYLFLAGGQKLFAFSIDDARRRSSRERVDYTPHPLGIGYGWFAPQNNPRAPARIELTMRLRS